MKEPNYIINFNVGAVSILLCVSILIGLMLEYSGRMKVQDDMDKKMDKLEYMMQQRDITENSIMPSCFIGDKNGNSNRHSRRNK